MSTRNDDSFKATILLALAQINARLAAIEARLPPTPLELQLTPTQKEVFDQLDTLTSRDYMGAEELLGRLQGQRITEGLVDALKKALKKKRLGVHCNCGAAAAPLWRRNLIYSAGGYMQFSHSTDSGKSVTHGRMVKLPRLAILERPDRRCKDSRS